MYSKACVNSWPPLCDENNFSQGFHKSDVHNKITLLFKILNTHLCCQTVYAGFAAGKKEKGFLFSFQIPENTQHVQKKLTWPAKS